MNKNKSIEVNWIRSLNDDQLEIIITGINQLRNSYVREIIETTFKIMERGDCQRCPLAPPINETCVCFFQDDGD